MCEILGGNEVIICGIEVLEAVRNVEEPVVVVSIQQIIGKCCVQDG